MIYYRTKDGFDKKKLPKFKYLDVNDKKINDIIILNYIKSLVIPPAYADVKIFYEKSPKILFQGYDDKGRLQQIYSQNHKKKASKKKFCNLLEFGKILPKITNDVNKYLKTTTYTKNKIISIIIKIVIKCGFRLGNIKYQKLYNSFGISNILKSHVGMKGSEMYIKFIGKKGVLNECIINEKSIIDEMMNLISKKSAKDYVFTYDDIIDNKVVNKVISALEINKFLKSYHINTTSKHFRTWDTNILFIEYMRNEEDPIKTLVSKRKKIVIAAMKIISTQINNTPNICKKEYLHIDLLTLYLESPNKFKKYFFGCDDASKCFIKYLDVYCG
jgi:DNA topoisomerase-1